MSDMPKAHRDRSSAGKHKSKDEADLTVVGIGCSAGGLEAATALLRSLPAELGMAYVFVPHLDPSRPSAFQEILARVTSMKVLEVKDDQRVEPNHVYVIPRNCEMKMEASKLRLFPREQPKPVNTTIDIFLRSLAADRGKNAIGVILSGTASDGTTGLTAVKGAGGITFAQDDTAKYDGMPASAIAAGCVDFVLSPENISNELARIARHPYVLANPETLEAVADTRESLMSHIFGILRRITRVDFSEYKPPTIARRVARRMALHKIEDLGEYVALLQRNRSEVVSLYQDLLINVTNFFRDPEAFDSLKTFVYPELLKRHGNGTAPIRIWVPGCSTGEEPYSHAISLLEYLGEERAEVPIQIFGTDLSETAVQRARAGLYKETIETDVSPVRLRRFFHRVDSGYQISKAIRDLCVFSTQNVFSDPPFSRIDLVSCRNVMIYLGHTLQRRVIPIFHYALNPNGFLMIGNTEGLIGSGAELFEMADKKQKIYRKKAVATPVTFGFSVHANEPQVQRGEMPNQNAPVPESSRAPMDLQREADRLLLSRYAPPSVLVNDQLEILQTKGRTGPYLELPVGKASLNLLKMARPGLLFELQNAIDEARASGVDATRRNVQVEGNDGSNNVNIRVTPFRTPVQDKASFLIAFESPSGNELASIADDLATPLSEDERTAKDKQITQLKQELAATKEYLQSIIEALESTNEELQSANEEIQSGNEELQSTNEELQTSKEELESANEELHTVNEEMQHRNELLTQLNNDLTNLLNSVNMPMVMVASDLSVRRFTPPAAKVLGLTSTDVGRPITRLKLKIEVPNLEEIMLGVIEEVRTRQLRVRNDEGEWCNLRLTPYRTADNRIDGVVLNVLGKDDLGSDGNEHPTRVKRSLPKKTKAVKPKLKKKK